MSAALVGLYALYFIAVGLRGNAENLWTFTQADFRSFVPWILALLILRALYSSQTLRPLVKPFIGLAALVFFLKNYSIIAGQLNAFMPAGVQLKTGSIPASEKT